MSLLMLVLLLDPVRGFFCFWPGSSRITAPGYRLPDPVGRFAALLLVLALPLEAELFVWYPEQVDTMMVLNDRGPVRLYFLSQFMGYGYYLHLAVVERGNAGLPDSFSVDDGFAVVSPDDYADTLEAHSRLQPLSQGPMPVLDRARSRLPNTLALLLIEYPFREPPDTTGAVWVLRDSVYVPAVDPPRNSENY